MSSSVAPGAVVQEGSGDERDAGSEATRRTLLRSRSTFGAGPPLPASRALHVAFVGSTASLDIFTPAPTRRMAVARVPVAASGAADLSPLADARIGASVVFDPPTLPSEVLRALRGVRLGVVTDGDIWDASPVRGVGEDPRGGARQGGARAAADDVALEVIDRWVSFDTAATGKPLGGLAGRPELWRAVPPPVADDLFGEVARRHGAPRVMALGRSTTHREAVLLPAKHRHDLLHLVTGVHGERLRALMREYDAGVYCARAGGAAFGAQVGMHLAAGHLLLAGPLHPSHGLERDIDYLHVDSGEQVTWMLERVARFPEMHHRIRVRGRMKAEQYRASGLFARLIHDALADVAAFGGASA